MEKEILELRLEQATLEFDSTLKDIAEVQAAAYGLKHPNRHLWQKGGRRLIEYQNTIAEIRKKLADCCLQ